MIVFLLFLIIVLILISEFHFFPDIMMYYTTILPIIYIAINFYYIKWVKNGELLNFEFFFAISFFLCSFITPIILPLLDNWYSRLFLDSPDVQFRTYIISMVGYLFYMLGLLIFKNKSNEHIEYFDNIINYKLVKISNSVCSIFILFFLLTGGTALLKLYSHTEHLENRLGTWGLFLVYSIISYTISVLINFLFLKQNKRNLFEMPTLFWVNSAILFLMLALSGYRSNLLQIAIPVFYVYNRYYKEIAKGKVIIFIVIGTLFALYSGFTRGGENLDFHTFEFISIFRDFSYANAANIYLIDYADNNGFTYGTNWILQILSVIPFLQSLFILLFGQSFIAQSSSSFFTDELSEGNGGLGTGIIGDLYYSAGLVGVCFFMFLLGLFCRKVSSGKSLVVIVMCLIFVGNSIFACRVEFFYIVRFMAFSAIIMWLELKMANIKKI